jgi:hypothetical protein
MHQFGLRAAWIYSQLAVLRRVVLLTDICMNIFFILARLCLVAT